MKLVYYDNSILYYYSNWQTGYRGRALIGGCREGVTSCSGFLGQSPESLGRAHNYESEARSYSGLYQGQTLHSLLPDITELVGCG